MVDVREEFSFDIGPLTVNHLIFFRQMALEFHDQQDLEFYKNLSEERRLIIRQLLAEVGRHRTDFTWEF